MNGLNIDIRKEIIETEKVLNSISHKAATTAKVQAINRVATRIKGQSAKAMSKAIKVKQKAIRKRIGIQKASAKVAIGRKTATTYATIYVKRRPLPAISAGKARQLKKGGVSVAGRKYKNAFLADGSKGFGKYIPFRMRGRAMKHPYRPTKLRTMQIFRRTSSSRNSLEVVTIPIKNQITHIVTQKTEELMRTDMPKELKSAMANQVRILIKKDIKRGN